ncbi:MAG: hypothetical protein IAE78_30480 [Myxococcus sp.]|nr:hypothetical protein [Myxococcus sp.]
MRLPALVLCLSLTACPATPTADGRTPALVLRSYEVPPGSGQRLRSVLKEVLWFGSEGKDANTYVGRVDVSPDGQLLVLAPASVHEGVDALVASVKARGLKEPETVTLTYWVVTGTPGAEQSQPMPEVIQPALTEVTKAEGPLGFTLAEQLSVSSLPGERGEMNGRDTSVDQFVSAVGEALMADLRLERLGQRIRTRVRLSPGKVVVLASSGAPEKNSGDASKRVFFIVKAATSAGDGR